MKALSPERDGLDFWIISKIRELRERAEGVHHDIGVLTGHGEPALDAPNLVSGQPVSMQGVVTQHFPTVRFSKVDLHGGADAVPPSLEGLIVLQPARDLSDAELARIDAFVMRGKALAVFASAVNVDPRGLQRGGRTEEGAVRPAAPRPDYLQSRVSRSTRPSSRLVHVRPSGQGDDSSHTRAEAPPALHAVQSSGATHAEIDVLPAGQLARGMQHTFPIGQSVGWRHAYDWRYTLPSTSLQLTAHAATPGVSERQHFSPSAHVLEPQRTGVTGREDSAAASSAFAESSDFAASTDPPSTLDPASSDPVSPPKLVHAAAAATAGATRRRIARPPTCLPPMTRSVPSLWRQLATLDRG